MEVSWVSAVFFKIFSEAENKIVNGAGGGVNIITPNRLQNFFPGYYIILVFQQQFQQHRFFTTQFDGFSAKIEGRLCFKVNGIFFQTGIDRQRFPYPVIFYFY